MTEHDISRCYTWPNSDILPVSQRLSLAFLFASFGIASLVGNALILTCLVKFRRLRSNSNLLLAHLTFADLIIGITAPLNISVYVIGSELPCFVFYACGFQTCYFCFASILLLVVIGADRYAHIVQYQIYDAYFTKKRVLLMAIMAWVISGLFSILYFTVEAFYFHVVVLAATLAAVSGIVFCYWRIFRKVRSSGLALSKHFNNPENTIPPSFQSQSQSQVVVVVKPYQVATQEAVLTLKPNRSIPNLEVTEKRRKRSIMPKSLIATRARCTRKSYEIAKTMAIVIFSVSVCWNPFMVTSFVRSLNFRFTGNQDSYVVSYHWLLLLGFANSSINPVIYSWRNKAIRDAMKELFRATRTG